MNSTARTDVICFFIFLFVFSRWHFITFASLSSSAWVISCCATIVSTVFSYLAHNEPSSLGAWYTIISRNSAIIELTLASIIILRNALRPTDSSPLYAVLICISSASNALPSLSCASNKAASWLPISVNTSCGSVLAISCTRWTSALYCIFCAGVGFCILLNCSLRSSNTSFTSPAVPLMSL